MTASASARASNPTVVWLDEADIERDLIGGKAASLNRLASFGFRIPPGFCLTTDAFAIQAASLPGKCMHLAVALQLIATDQQLGCVELGNVACERFGLNRNAKYRALLCLENAGLVIVKRKRGRSPLVTILDGTGTA